MPRSNEPLSKGTQIKIPKWDTTDIWKAYYEEPLIAMMIRDIALLDWLDQIDRPVQLGLS